MFSMVSWVTWLRSGCRSAICVLLLSCSLLHAALHPDGSALFFVSNNTGIIGMHEAYQRLTGPEQKALKNKIIEVAAADQVDPVHFEALLGRYQMSDNQAITADNVEVFETSPDKTFTDDRLFALAAQLANALHQDSVAVFVFHHQASDGRFVLFLQRHRSIGAITKQIERRLPSSYTVAYSLHLEPGHRSYRHARVSSVEWLGTTPNTKVLSDAFRKQKVTSEHGAAYLVYRDGKVQAL